jgi:hypothetical protein
VAFVGGGDRFFLQSQSAESINIKQNGDRLGLEFVSKAGQPFELEQAAVSGAIFVRSDAVLGDLVSVRFFCGGRSSLESQGDRIKNQTLGE